MMQRTHNAGRAIDTERIRPAIKGESDKFSWRLYRWMVRHGEHYNRIYALRWNCLDGHIPDADPHDMDTNKIWCGARDPELRDWHGQGLRNITAGHGRIVCCINEWPNAVDITDWFWREYLRIGRCLFHGDMVHQWHYTTTWDRTCEYCGKRETMHRKLAVQWKDEWRAAA